MKRIFSCILSVLLVFGLMACGNSAPAESVETTETPSTNPPTTIKSLRVLAIGNSFSVDAMEHLYAVAQAEGVAEIVLGNLYIPGCPLDKHAANCASGEEAYKYYKNTTGEWAVAPQTVSLLHGLQDEQWDIITMQQASPKSGLADTYKPYLEQLVTFVNENKTNPDAKLFWHMTWAYQCDSTQVAFARYANDQQTMYLGIVNALQKEVEPSNAFEKILPVGTAIQNARTSYMGDKLTRDGFHLSNMGRVIAAYTWYAVIDGQPLYAVNIDRADSLKLTESDKRVIVEAVNAAIQNPYEVTKSAILVP